MKTLVKLFVLLMAVTLVGACSNSGGEGGEKGAEKAKEVTAKDFGAQMCEAATKGDVDQILGLMHPKIVETQAAADGKTVDEVKQMMAEGMKDHTPESCEVKEAADIECSEEVLASAEALELKVDKCAELTTTMKVADQDASDEKVTLINIEGKWYMSIN